LCVLAGLLGLLAAAWFARAPVDAALRQVLAARYQRDCLAFTMPDGLVVYEEHELAANHLLSVGAGSRGRWHAVDPGDAPTERVAAWEPSAWDGFLRTSSALGRVPPRSEDAVIFLHERRCPAGRRRLVVVRARPFERNSVLPTLRVDTFAIDPTSGAACLQTMYSGGAGVDYSGDPGLITALDGFRVGIDPRAPVRIFGGRADPDDASRFGFVCEQGGVRYVVEGRLAATEVPRMCGNAPSEMVTMHVRRE
jgi:hypothetical protein